MQPELHPEDDTQVTLDKVCKRVLELEAVLAEVVLHARPAFRGTPFRKALDRARELLK